MNRLHLLRISSFVVAENISISFAGGPTRKPVERDGIPSSTERDLRGDNKLQRDYAVKRGVRRRLEGLWPMELPKRHDIAGTYVLLSVIMVNSNVEEACVECRGGRFGGNAGFLDGYTDA